MFPLFQEKYKEIFGDPSYESSIYIDEDIREADDGSKGRKAFKLFFSNVKEEHRSKVKALVDKFYEEDL